MATGDLGKLVVQIAADASDLAKGLKKAEDSVGAFKIGVNKILGGIGFAAVTAGFVAVTKSALDYGDQLQKISTTTGLAASEVAKLKFAAEQSETSIEGLTNNIAFLSRRMVEAAQGNLDARRAFSAMNIEYKNADGTLRSYQEVLLEVADRIANTKDRAVALAAAQNLLGRSAKETFNFYAQGADGIRRLSAEFDKFGVSAAKLNEFAKRSDDLKDRWHALQTAFQLVGVELVSRLVPMLEKMVETLLNVDWQKVAMDIEAVASVFIKMAEAVAMAVDWLQKYSPLAAAARFAGTIAGGGGIGEAAAAAGNAAIGQPVPEVDLGTLKVPSAPQAGSGAGAGIPQIRELDALAKKMEEIKTKWGDLHAGMRDVAVAALDTYVTSFGTAFAEMIGHGKDFGDALKQMWEELKMAVLKAIGEMIAKWLAFMALRMAGRFMGLPFSEGGAVVARSGLVYAQEGLLTGGHGERGIPAVVHPNEIISPIDKFFDAVRSVAPVSMVIQGDVKDPYEFSRMIGEEVDRARRRP